MAEYIKREDAIKCVESQCVDGKMWGNDESEGTLIEAYSTIDDLMDIPAADVAPVRHGRWILDEYARYFRCSACGTQFDDETDIYCNIMNGFAPNYCEECGAKMDGADHAT